MPSVLLVPATQPARLEDMSPAEPSRWLRTHSVWRKGKHSTRQKGDKVGALAEPWRRLRADCPDYFEDGK
eukprot:13629330-Alexandrium_andersonii.AAC.1